jgi:hypothetical protein
MNLFVTMSARSAILFALLFGLCGCLSNPERPDASVYGDPPHAYEKTAKDAVSALPYFNSHSDTWHFVSVGAPYRAYQNGVPVFRNKLTWTGYVVEVVVSVKNHIGYSNQDTFWVEFDGDRVHEIAGAGERPNKF